MSLINYRGDSKLLKRICALLNVKDVQDGQGHSLVDENGVAIVSGGGGGSSTLAGLSDVSVTGVQAGDALCYNGTSNKWEDKTLATVATSGSYNDLSNKPTIPAAQVNSDWNSSSGVSEILNKPSLSTVATSGAYSDLSGKPSKLSDFSNDEGFIDNTVNNLTNYYKKSETYTQAEVDALISAVVTIDIEVVSVLPTSDISTTTIYLVPKTTAATDNVYDEYINTDGTSAGWELIGDTTVDLSNYYTKSEVDALIPDDLADLNDDSTHRVVTDTEKSTWSAKVDDNPTFSEASARTNIASGESFATILGKIKKYFTDLKTVAFSGSYSDLTNQPTIPSVSANPATTTATLTGIEIDGTNYAVQGGSANVQSDWNQTDTTADDYIKNKPSLAAVATSGSYSDLSNKPTIPAAQVNSDWTASSGVSQILNKPSLATVATSGSYSDLSNKPTIPAAQVNSDWNSASGVSQILNKPTIPAAVYMGQIGSGNSILNVLLNTAPLGNTLWQTQQADDSPNKGNVSSVLMCKHTNNGTYSYVYHFGGGKIRTASTGNPAPSSLTWSVIDANNANYANSAGSATDSTKEPKLGWTYKSNWNYWKDSGNRYHLTYLSGNLSINFNGSIGNLKYRNTTYDITYPVTLTSTYSIQVTMVCGNDVVGANIQSYSTTGVKLWLWAATSGTKTCNIFLDIIST